MNVWQLSKDKKAVERLATEGQIIESPHDLIKDPYVLEFLGLPELPEYSETELENRIINNLQKFCPSIIIRFLRANMKRYCQVKRICKSY